jgi:hypothetical protein
MYTIYRKELQGEMSGRFEEAWEKGREGERERGREGEYATLYTYLYICQ